VTFIKSFSINTDRQQPFPFNIPAVRFARNVQLDEKVTIFVGDNGCGKSTLLESIAYQLDVPLIGGRIEESDSFAAVKLLKPSLEIEWKRETGKGFFFRAEDFSAFINGLDREKAKIMMSLHELKGQVDESVIEKMSDSMRFYLREMIKK
jgi:predicted ATPase